MLLIIFWLFALVMMGLALSLIIPVLMGAGSKSSSTAQRTKTNVEIYKERLAELEQEQLSDEAFQQQKRELDKNLAQELEAADESLRATAPQSASLAKTKQQKPEPDKNLAQGLEATDESAPATAAPQGASSFWIVVLIILVLPIAAVGGYLLSAQPAVFTWLMAAEHDDAPTQVSQVTPAPLAETATPVTPSSVPQVPENFDEMIAQLAARLEKEPNDIEGWMMLGRSHMIMSHYSQAAAAYARAIEIVGRNNPELLASLAEAKALAAGGHLAGEPIELVQEALALDANHGQSLWLAGMAAYQSIDDAQAISYWQQFLDQLEDNQDTVNAREMVTNYLQLAQQRLAGDVVESEIKPDNTTPVTLTVKVQLADALSMNAQPEDTVFIFVGAVAGPPMPLAVARYTVTDLPVTISMDDSMAMIATHKLSDFKRVQVGARISKSGEPTAQSGDLEGRSGVLTLPETTSVTVTIDEVVP